MRFIRQTGLLVLSLLCVVMGQALAQDVEKWHVTKQSPGSQDKLVYRLEYQGLFTAFVWTSLADVSFASARNKIKFDGKNSCELDMRLSTENFNTEDLYPFRYEWRSLVSPDLNKVFLVEEISKGVKEEYKATWLNWNNKEINFYRKRNQIKPENYDDTEDQMYGTETVESEQKIEWEKDGAKPVPDFLNQQTPLEGKYTYLVYDKSVKLASDLVLTDPLGLMYATRWHDYRASPVYDYDVSYKDEIRKYRIKELGRETVEIGSHQIPAIKVDVMRKSPDEAEAEGFVMVWLSDDNRRIPLKYEISAVLGWIRLNLTETSYNSYKKPQTCLDVNALRKMSKMKKLSTTLR
jgi:hypothetical protein